MENAMTRIADLPMDNNNMSGQMATSYSPMVPNGQSMSQGMNGPSISGQGMPGNYIPINVHPNPYGVSAQNPIMPNPQQTSAPQQQMYAPPPPQSQYLTEDQQMQLNNMKPQRLPSRDIPHDSLGYSQDEEIQPNYIPKAKQNGDYVREHEDMTEKNLRKHEEKKRKESRFDALMNDIQTPIFVAILFFFFQLPLVNRMIFKRFSFLSIYDTDGNFNFYGLVFKSLIFGGVYYSMNKAMTFLSEF